MLIIHNAGILDLEQHSCLLATMAECKLAKSKHRKRLGPYPTNYQTSPAHAISWYPVILILCTSMDDGTNLALLHDLTLTRPRATRQSGKSNHKHVKPC